MAARADPSPDVQRLIARARGHVERPLAWADARHLEHCRRGLVEPGTDCRRVVTTAHAPRALLGVLLAILAFGLSDSVVALFALIPQAVLGTVLFMTGVQLAGGQFDAKRAGHDSTILLVTAGLSMWNVAIGFAIGLLLQWVLGR